MGSLLRVVGLVVGALLASGPVQAGVVTCVRPGVPVDCSSVGVRPAAGPGVGPNYGGPANVHPANRPGMR